MHRIRTWARQKAHGPEPLIAESRRSTVRIRSNQNVQTLQNAQNAQNATRAKARTANPPKTVDGDHVTPAPDELAESTTEKMPETKSNVAIRFCLTVKDILFSSIINVLLVFVPVGIAAHFAGMSAGIIFGMNAIAIIPLAGLLSHATESVAKRMGDTVGALMNVTFGNAVELIIFIIALVKNEIRVVQASLVGSILANLLLILGMCFLLGGLRYREQIYNSTVTQMSACLLSLSVSSLLLPTAFHASFNNSDDADSKVVQVSRGTSVVLLLVYLLYLVFQLNSHAYMYESTPLETIERESLPGPAAGYFNSSSSSSESSSSSSNSDSDQSHRTARRIKRTFKKGRNKIYNRTASIDEPATLSTSPTLSAPSGPSPVEVGPSDDSHPPAVDAEAADDEREVLEMAKRHKHKQKHKKHREARAGAENATASTSAKPFSADDHARRVDFALAPDVEAQAEPRPKPFSLRTLANPSVLTKTLSVNVFNPNSQGEPATQDPSSSMSHARASIPQPQLRRTASMPTDDRRYNVGPGTFPPIVPIIVNRTPKAAMAGEDGQEEEVISRTTAIVLLLVSTGLVALCAEFMVGSIDALVSEETGLSEAFIGLIILPIVGNAAEHVTGVTVAMKNKMDLAIGVALGSSIQIALFVTPIVVILGWIMNKEMGLYFTIFETVSMFVSAFIVNFLVLDGRSNYLEGALLCSAYVIIAVAAFFYPNSDAASSLGGGS